MSLDSLNLPIPYPHVRTYCKLQAVQCVWHIHGRSHKRQHAPASQSLALPTTVTFQAFLPLEQRDLNPSCSCEKHHATRIPLLFPRQHEHTDCYTSIVMHSNQILSRNTVEGLIAAGHVIVIKDGSVLQLDGWIDKHPGGRLSMLHMVGRDATDEINA